MYPNRGSPAHNFKKLLSACRVILTGSGGWAWILQWKETDGWIATISFLIKVWCAYCLVCSNDLSKSVVTRHSCQHGVTRKCDNLKSCCGKESFTRSMTNNELPLRRQAHPFCSRSARQNNHNIFHIKGLGSVCESLAFFVFVHHVAKKMMLYDLFRQTF